MTEDAAPNTLITGESTPPPRLLMKDPTVGAYVFFSKHLPLESEHDARLHLITLLERALERLELQTVGDAPHSEPSAIDFYAVHTSPPQKAPIINRVRQTQTEIHQGLAFTFMDALAAQVMQSHPGYSSPEQVLRQAQGFINELITPELLSGGEEGQWGGRFFVWGVVPEHSNLDEALAMLANAFHVTPKKSSHCHFGVFSEITINAVEGLLLLTYDTPEAENWANRTLFDHSPALPPALLLLELARCKFDWEFEQYRSVKPTLDRLSQQIDRRLSWMIDTQRAYEKRLAVVGSRESIELLSKLSNATTDFADFRRAVTRVNELRTTLQINSKNYLSFLRKIAFEKESDYLFRQRWQQMERIQTQLKYEGAYFTAALERGQTVLDAASTRLEILRGEQEREQITFQGIQTSAITAIMAGLAALQVLPVLAGIGSPWFVGALVITLMASTFALSQIVINWKRVNTLADRIGVAITSGVLLSLPVVARWSLRPSAVQLLSTLLLFVTGTLVGYALFIFFEERRRRKDDDNRMRQFDEGDGDIGQLLARAREELRNLLDDLPPTEIYRIKAQHSLAEKLERKGYEKLTEVGDEIGVRYVVSPWEIPRTVERVKSLVRVREIEYKQGDYKAVHLLADLLGPGDDRDLDLTAEIQVKTHWQNRFAIFAHDRLYKPGARRPGILARLYGWMLARITSVELYLFRRSMGWPSKPQIKPFEQLTTEQKAAPPDENQKSNA